jgi:hypothetical protein
VSVSALRSPPLCSGFRIFSDESCCEAAVSSTRSRTRSVSPGLLMSSDVMKYALGEKPVNMSAKSWLSAEGFSTGSLGSMTRSRPVP